MPLSELPSRTVNLIKSSQVITSFSSIIKELVENSIDAEGTILMIKLVNYGLDNIEVKDNGIGISEEDIKFVAKPHFTSKITRFEDLENLSSYGFRGEALSSLCAVSDVTISSRSKEVSHGFIYKIDKFGNVTHKQPTAITKGTAISIQNLFKNVPVRRQFYSNTKRKREELKKIESLVMSFAIIKPHLHITLIHDKHVIFQKPASSNVKTSLHFVFHDSAKKFVHKESNFGDNKIEVWLPKGEEGGVSCSSSEKLFIFINERPVNDKTIEKLIKAYFSKNSEGTHGRYPVGVVLISVPSSAVDVNLEPNKTKVLLLELEKVLEALQKLLSQIYGNVLSADGKKELKRLAGLEDELPCTLTAQLTQEEHFSDNNLSEILSSEPCNLQERKALTSSTNCEMQSDKFNGSRNLETKNVEINEVLQEKENIPCGFRNSDRNPSEERVETCLFLTSNPTSNSNFSINNTSTNTLNLSNINEPRNIEVGSKETSVALKAADDCRDKVISVRTSSLGSSSAKDVIFHKDAYEGFSSGGIAKSPNSEPVITSKENLTKSSNNEKRITSDLTIKTLSNNEQSVAFNGTVINSSNYNKPIDYLANVCDEGRVSNEDQSTDKITETLSNLDDQTIFPTETGRPNQPRISNSINELSSDTGVLPININYRNEINNGSDLICSSDEQPTVNVQIVFDDPSNEDNTNSKMAAHRGAVDVENLTAKELEFPVPSDWRRGQIYQQDKNIQSVNVLKVPKNSSAFSVNQNLRTKRKESDPFGDAEDSSHNSKKVKVNSPKASFENLKSFNLKKPESAFSLFAKSIRKEVMEQNPGVDFTIIAQELATRWRNASPDVKELYERKAAERRQVGNNRSNASILPVVKNEDAKENEMRDGGHSLKAKPWQKKTLAVHQTFQDIKSKIVRKQRLEEPSEFIIGNLKGMNGWIYCIDGNIFGLNTSRMNELILFRTLIGSFTLPTIKLEIPISLSSRILGDENWDTLLAVNRKPSTTNNELEVVESRITSNGFKIILIQGVNGIERGEITNMTDISGFGIDQLMEILSCIRLDPKSSLQKARPPLLIKWCKDQSYRMSKASPYIRDLAIVVEKMNMWCKLDNQGKNKHQALCLHGNPVFHLIKRLK